MELNLSMPISFVIVKSIRLPLPEVDRIARMIPVLWNRRTGRSSEGR